MTYALDVYRIWQHVEPGSVDPELSFEFGRGGLRLADDGVCTPECGGKKPPGNAPRRHRINKG